MRSNDAAATRRRTRRRVTGSRDMDWVLVLVVPAGVHACKRASKKRKFLPAPRLQEAASLRAATATQPGWDVK